MLWPSTPRGQYRLNGADMTDDSRGHMDIRMQRQTYHGFMQLVKWGIILNVILLALMAIFLV